MLQDVSSDCNIKPVARVRRRATADPSLMTLQPVRFAIELAVARVFGVQSQSLTQETRGEARAAHARQVAMYLAHVTCRMSLTDAGRLFGRDRTTVAHACLVIEEERDDPIFDQALDLLEWAVPVVALRPAPYLRHY